jgi:hypothetical protein
MNNTNYEFFIRRAWECERFQYGANTDTWDSLLYKKVSYEKAIGTVLELKNKKEFDKLFLDVKHFIDAAYDNLLKRANSINENETLINSILDLKIRASNSTSPSELFEVLSESFPLLNDYNF